MWISLLSEDSQIRTHIVMNASCAYFLHCVYKCQGNGRRLLAYRPKHPCLFDCSNGSKGSWCFSPYICALCQRATWACCFLSFGIVITNRHMLCYPFRFGKRSEMWNLEVWESENKTFESTSKISESSKRCEWWYQADVMWLTDRKLLYLVRTRVQQMLLIFHQDPRHLLKKMHAMTWNCKLTKPQTAGHQKSEFHLLCIHSGFL